MSATILERIEPGVEQGNSRGRVWVHIELPAAGMELQERFPADNRVGSELLADLCAARLSERGVEVHAWMGFGPLNRAFFSFDVDKLPEALTLMIELLGSMFPPGCFRVAWKEGSEVVQYHPASGQFEFPSDEEMAREAVTVRRLQVALQAVSAGGGTSQKPGAGNGGRQP